MESIKTEVLISDEYKTRENQLIRFNKWADYEGLDLRMSGEFEHSNKETHTAYLGFRAGQQFKQADVDELQKRIDGVVKKLQLIKADTLRPSHYDYDKGWRDCAITALNGLKGDQP